MRLDYDTYAAEIGDDGISIFLDGRRYAVLRIPSALDSADKQDIDGPLSGPEKATYEDGVDLIWRSKSELWREKTYQWHFEPRLFWYRISVKGRNRVTDLRFFDGAAPNVYGWSFFDFSQFFTPECSLLDQRYWKSMQYGCIDASSGRMSDFPRDPNADNHWIFTPPPLCYSLGFSSGPWLAAGIASEPRQYNFSRFEYVPGPNSFCFRLTYDGMTRVDGAWNSPTFVFLPAEDEYSAIARHCEILRTWKLVNDNKHEPAEWWSRPIFCGWGEQNVTAIRMGGVSSNSLARQSVYDKFLAIIREKNLNPGTIIIDDKWQKHYGTCEVDTEKWPDLRRWIDDRHEEGRRVLLWYGAWNPEGIPDEETITDPHGRVCCVDPTNPAYQDRLREMMHRLLSSEPGCCNADGIKYDWTNGTPVGPGYSLYGDEWGIELLKLYTKTIYDAAKAAKPDALVITHTANPYFAECTDMIRLNDIFVGCREIASMMTHRQRIARIACPHALIDCDNSSAPDHTEWLEYTKLQPSLGVPSLYFLTGFDGTLESITDKDWEELAEIWRRKE